MNRNILPHPFRPIHWTIIRSRGFLILGGLAALIWLALIPSPPAHAQLDVKALLSLEVPTNQTAVSEAFTVSGWTVDISARESKGPDMDLLRAYRG
jgi:hypothetical protein